MAPESDFKAAQLPSGGAWVVIGPDGLLRAPDNGQGLTEEGAKDLAAILNAPTT